MCTYNPLGLLFQIPNEFKISNTLFPRITHNSLKLRFWRRRLSIVKFDKLEYFYSMIISKMTTSRLSTWKDFFLNSTKFDYLNSELCNLRESIKTLVDFLKSFEEISKNPGISFISLDPTETKLRLFHHPTVIGGS